MQGSSFQQLLDTVRGPSTNVLALLREHELIPPAEIHGAPHVVNGRALDTTRAGALHLGARTPYVEDGSRVAGLFAQDAYYVAMGTEPLVRLPSFSSLNPYLILYFQGLPPSTRQTVALDLEVYSVGGTVRITATNNPLAVLVTHAATGGAPATVPVTLTTTAEGFSSLLLQRVGETGFDWLGATLL